jgi:hypothetical protein
MLYILENYAFGFSLLKYGDSLASSKKLFKFYLNLIVLEGDKTVVLSDLGEKI